MRFPSRPRSLVGQRMTSDGYHFLKRRSFQVDVCSKDFLKKCLGPWVPGVPGPSGPRALGSLGPRVPRPTGPLALGGPWAHGCLGPRVPGPTGPWPQGSVGPGIPGPTSAWALELLRPWALELLRPAPWALGPWGPGGALRDPKSRIFTF